MAARRAAPSSTGSSARRSGRALLLLAALLTLGLYGEALACPGEGYCEVAGGRYLALPPPDWDGKRPLEATIFFHGYAATAQSFAADPEFTAAFAREGVMLVLPDGINKTWAHQGSPSHARDELAFMDAVRADLLARWPIDPRGLLVTGFSQGGSMVWYLACYRGRDYAAFAAVAGAFWEPMPKDCPGGPVDLLHIHGTSDRTVPMAGRPIGTSWRQGDVMGGLKVLRGVDGCPEAPSKSDSEDGLACEVWQGCASGREIRLCEHDQGHMMPERWVALAHAWARGLRAQGQSG